MWLYNLLLLPFHHQLATLFSMSSTDQSNTEFDGENKSNILMNSKDIASETVTNPNKNI